MHQETQVSSESLISTFAAPCRNTTAPMESAPSVQMHHAPTALDPGADSDEDDEAEAAHADHRPRRGHRPHLAEYFDDDETDADRMISGRMGLDAEDIGEMLQCGCVDECECRPTNPFVSSFKANGR